MIANQSSIWTNIIDWEKKATLECKDYFKEKIENILVEMMKKKELFPTVLNITSKMTDV